MEKLKFQNKNDVLVAIINSIKDFAILKNELWYRIPVSTAPKNIINGQAKTVAFYQTSVFKERKWLIELYAKIKETIIVDRKDIFPNEPENSLKFNKKYYKILFEKLDILPKPIVSLKGRRITFIPTTMTKFLNANEINQLFNESPLEDIFFEAMLKNKIPCERQFKVSIEKKNFFLDFAIFCNHHDICVECDGDLYHNKPKQVKYDKRRDNLLKNNKWDVYRFTTQDINENLDYSLSLIKNAIKNQQDLLTVNEERPQYIRTSNQLSFFDI